METLNIFGVVLAVAVLVAVFAINKKIKSDIQKDRPRITDQPPFKDDDGSEQKR